MMTEESSTAPRTRTRSREQLLKLLDDNPSAVSRAEIKAAFADGRLGDEDLDIPVVAGLRRITDLLADLRQDAPTENPPSTAPSPASGGSRAATTTARPDDLEDRVRRIETDAAAGPPEAAPSVADVEALRLALREVESRAAAQADRFRSILAIAVVALALAAAAMLVAIAVH